MLIAAVVWLASWMITVLSDWRATSAGRGGAASVAGARPRGVELSDFLDGEWSFEGAPSVTGVTHVADEQLPARLIEPPAPSACDGERGTADGKMIALLRSLKVQPVQQAGYDLYRYRGVGMEAAAFVGRVRGQEHVAALRVALRDASGQWLLIENQPARFAAGSADFPDALPLPPAARCTGKRYSRKGRVLSEVVVLKGDLDALRQFWRQAGWDVADAGLPADRRPHLRCCKQGAVWHAWWNGRDGGDATLLLVREPEA
jgi:hypothetical protein